MKKCLLCSAFAVALAIPSLQADESVRSAQILLQSAGYYTSSVDGELNAETKAALRRYQIRNQLEPSGELTAETVTALNKEGQSAAATTPAPQPTAIAPTVPEAPNAVQGSPASDNTEYDRIFAHTPYERAAMENQVETLRKAQILLAERGLFQGVTDGRPSSETEEALLRFQASREMPRTGRLDIDTLAELHLLPVGKLHRPDARRPYAPQPPHGAVRGVPLD